MCISGALNILFQRFKRGGGSGAMKILFQGFKRGIWSYENTFPRILRAGGVEHWRSVFQTLRISAVKHLNFAASKFGEFNRLIHWRS